MPSPARDATCPRGSGTSGAGGWVAGCGLRPADGRGELGSSAHVAGGAVVVDGGLTVEVDVVGLALEVDLAGLVDVDVLGRARDVDHVGLLDVDVVGVARDVDAGAVAGDLD